MLLYQNSPPVFFTHHKAKRIINHKIQARMKNLRITTKKQFIDQRGTGDYSSFNVFEVRRDFTDEELSKANYSTEVISNGVVIENFTSEDNAQIFLNALKGTYSVKPKILITSMGGVIQNVVSNCEMEYVIVDYDNDEEHLLTETKRLAPDLIISGQQKFHEELFNEELNSIETILKSTLKKIDF